MCKNCVHHQAELRDHQCQSPHMSVFTTTSGFQMYIQPENFLLLLCVLTKNNVQQSWERWSTWSIWSIWWWSIYSHTHGLLQFNSFNTHSWVIPPNSAISPHHLSPSTQQQQWYAHVNPTNLMGSSFAIHPICDWWLWLCMLLNLHTPHIKLNTNFLKIKSKCIT